MLNKSVNYICQLFRNDPKLDRWFFLRDYDDLIDFLKEHNFLGPRDLKRKIDIAPQLAHFRIFDNINDAGFKTLNRGLIEVRNIEEKLYEFEINLIQNYKSQPRRSQIFDCLSRNNGDIVKCLESMK